MFGSDGGTRKSTRVGGAAHEPAVNSAFTRLVQALGAQGVTWPLNGYLVGGSVRDALLHRPSKDFDWVVPDPAAAARALADSLGGSAFEMDSARRHWRVAVADGVLHDFAPVREGASDITGDLALRDLTINALALGQDGRLLDPTGGMDDLNSRVVRTTSLEALRADPVRPLRAVRLAAALEFRIEDRTLSAMALIGVAQADAAARSVRELGRDLEDGSAANQATQQTVSEAGNSHANRQRNGEPGALPAFERVGAELSALLATAKAAQGFKLLCDLGLLGVYLPELQACKGVDQGRGFHHLDVLDHSLEALNQLLHGFPEADLPLRWATLLHDVGKPPTKGKGPFGRVTFYGHDKEGAALTARALRRVRVESATVQRSSSLVRYHMLPLPRGEREAKRFVHKRRQLLPDLLKLMIADREAARGPLSSEAGRRAYRVALGQVIELMKETPARKPLLSGTEVIELLGISPGPRVGEALALVAEAHALGDLKDAADARAFLQRYAKIQGW